jgi:hypothetical protein
VITAGDIRAESVRQLADAIEKGCEDAIGDESLALTALCLVIARRLALSAHDEEGAKSGAVLVARMVAAATAIKMKEKLGG